MREPWRPGRTLYQLHSLGACGAPSTNPDVDAREPSGRGLRLLTGWLDHVESLGCGGVLLTPIAVSSTHGYDVVDPFRVDQRLGDDADFAAFVDACHDRDLEVVLDAVFNHVGRDFPAFRDVLANRDASRWAGWFRLDFERDDGDGFGYHCFEGHRTLVSLDHSNDEVGEWATSVARHWLDRGADGWRLDVAYAIPAPFLSHVTRDLGDAFVFGEMIHGDYVGKVRDGGLGSVTQYELYKAIWSSLNDANLFELAWALGRHRELLAVFSPVTFIGNHDVNRIGSQLDDPAHVSRALVLLFTVPGVPCVYYGDELGWRGTKEARIGGDDAIRPQLPANPDPADDEQAGILDLHRRLVGLRRDRPWLASADVEVIDVANRTMGYEVRGDGDALRVVISVDDDVVSPDGWGVVLRTAGAVVCERS